VTLLSNTDIILVRHFFNPVVSGQYAALSLMGKAIFVLHNTSTYSFLPGYGIKKERKERLFRTLMLASGIVVGISAILSAVYFIVPELVLKVFLPEA